MDKSNYKKTCQNTYHPLTNLGQKLSILPIQSISLISGAQWIDTVNKIIWLDKVCFWFYRRCAAAPTHL